MKKFYTIASTLLLALGMTAMTACSGENDPVMDEPAVPGQPTEPASHIVTLTVDAGNDGGTRIAVETSDVKDAFSITGWKDGDVVKVLALKTPSSEIYKEIAFTYDANTRVFTGDIAGFELSDLKHAYVGASLKEAMRSNLDYGWSIDLDTPIAISNPEDCFLFGDVSVVNDEQISATLSAPYALACVHNYRNTDIEVGHFSETGLFMQNNLNYSLREDVFRFMPELIYPGINDGDPLTYKVPSGGKVYFVIPPRFDSGSHYYGLYDFTNKETIAEPKENVTLGKVYKVQVIGPTKGTAKAMVNGEEVDVNWIQLWAGGPKFAEHNVANNLTFSEATQTGSDYVWGANWRTPTRDELDELVKASHVELSSTKVKCELIQSNGEYYFKFTSLEKAFAGNEVIFPNHYGDQEDVFGQYWSSTVSFYSVYGNNYGWAMSLWHRYHWFSKWEEREDSKQKSCYVRPVLVEDK